MKIGVLCEESQAVTIAFREQGHEAYSIDIQPCSGGHPEWHIQDDALKYLRGWDMIIAHPPCTYLSSSGMHWTTRGLRAPQLTDQALEFVQTIMDAACVNIVIENPIGVISSRIRKPEQIIQPWMFGDDASKQTCLWIKGLPLLIPTYIVPPKGYKTIKFAGEMPLCECCGEESWCRECQEHFADCECFGPTQEGITYKNINKVLFGTNLYPAPKPIWANQTISGQNKLGPSPDRAKLRSKTFPGIAKAMAEQWG